MSLMNSPGAEKRRRLFLRLGALIAVLLVTLGVFAKNGWFPSAPDPFTGKRTGWFGKPLAKNVGSSWNDAFKGMTKMSYSETSANGVLSEVHYVKDPRTGALMDFKFKPSTIQKTNSVTRYANATKHGTIVAPK
jgi:hypothetical protein